MNELEITARELILAIMEKTLKTLKDKGLLKEPSKLQMLCSSPEMKSLIKKLSPPKYDPCRLFREGDKAKPRIINGREIPKMPLDVIFTVTGDEDEYGAVPVEYMSPVRGLLTSTTVHAVWLELVTPVEELEPYCVRKYSSFYAVEKYNNHTARPATYDIDFHPHAKASAEAERDRLNEEYRKEQNDVSI